MVATQHTAPDYLISREVDDGDRVGVAVALQNVTRTGVVGAGGRVEDVGDVAVTGGR